MNVKIDTKEIFHVISILEEEVTANMSATFLAIIAKTQLAENKSIIFDFTEVKSIDEEIGNNLLKISQEIYSNNKSCVLCNLVIPVKEQLDKWGILNELNTTPTLSEAWDIVQMEEIERELGADFSELA